MSDPGTTVATRARELASWQCEVEEIAAVIAQENGWDEERTASFMLRMAAVITQARLVARAEMRGQLWRAARGKPSEDDPVMDKDRYAILSELMRQHAGWSRHAPMDELMRAFIAAQKAHDAKGPKRGPTGVAA